jgi:hypothetical protein
MMPVPGNAWKCSDQGEIHCRRDPKALGFDTHHGSAPSRYLAQIKLAGEGNTRHLSWGAQHNNKSPTGLP